MDGLSYSRSGLTLTVDFDRYTYRDRVAWRYAITADDETLHEGADLETTGFDLIEALQTLHSFLSAWDESRRYAGDEGENAHLFPAELHDRADWSSWLDYAYPDLHGEGEQGPDTGDDKPTYTRAEIRNGTGWPNDVRFKVAE